jgi:TonB family protein
VQGNPKQIRAFLGPHETPKKGHFTAAPHPSYPADAVPKKIEGIGVFEVYFRSDGSVSHVAVFRSTGHRVLDKECISTFKRWRCDPGTVTWFRVPVRFVIETK